jgi:hypothetical protein
MKYFFIGTAFFIYSCTGRTNSTITGLLKDQKNIEDSINFASDREGYYMKQALANDPDTRKMKKYIDSSLYFLSRGQTLKKKLASVVFSIDSLSKMK